jgi:hypothetical protein
LASNHSRVQTFPWAIGLRELKAAVESSEKLQAPAEAQRNDKLHEQIAWLQYENALGKVWRTANRKLDELRKDTDRDKAALARPAARSSSNRPATRTSHCTLHGSRA